MPLMDMAGPAHGGTETANNADSDTISAENGRRDFGRAKTVLDRLHHSLRAKQGRAALRGSLDVESLGGDDDEIAGADAVRGGRAVDRHGAIAADAFTAQALGVHGLCMIGPCGDRVDLMAGIDHQGGIDRAHRAAADNCDFRHMFTPCHSAAL